MKKRKNKKKKTKEMCIYTYKKQTQQLTELSFWVFEHVNIVKW